MLALVNKGKDNTIIGDIKLFSGGIKFYCNNSVVKLPVIDTGGKIDISIYDSDSTVDISGVKGIGFFRCICKNSGNIHLGEFTTIQNAYFLADNANILLGKDCMISFQVSFRTTDAHGMI